MGYFPNGTEGMAYQEHYCDRCANQNDDGGCPILDAHLMFAYELCNEIDHPGKRILDMLIPENSDGLGNARCTLFRAANAIGDLLKTENVESR